MPNYIKRSDIEGLQEKMYSLRHQYKEKIQAHKIKDFGGLVDNKWRFESECYEELNKFRTKVFNKAPNNFKYECYQELEKHYVEIYLKEIRHYLKEDDWLVPFKE